MTPTNDKIKKAIKLLEGIKSVFQPVSGEVMVVVSCDEWDKVTQAKSLLRSIPAESQEPTLSPDAVCDVCGGSGTIKACSKGLEVAEEPCMACQPVEPPKPTVVLKPVNPKGHTPDCDFTLDGCACTCGYSGKEPKAEDFEQWFTMEGQGIISHYDGQEESLCKLVWEARQEEIDRLEDENRQWQETVKAVQEHSDRLKADLRDEKERHKNNIVSWKADNKKHGDSTHDLEAKFAKAFAMIRQQRQWKIATLRDWKAETDLLKAENKHLFEELIDLKKALGEK